MQSRAIYQGPPIVLVLGVLFGSFGLAFAAFYLQRHVLPPTDRLIAGPLHGGAWFLLPMFVASMYFLFSIIFVASAVRQSGAPCRSAHVLRLLITGSRGRFAAAVLTCCCGALGYGLSVFSYATPSGLTIHSGWPAEPVTYAWSDMTKRYVSCYRVRGGPNVVFQVHMKDGQAIDLADTQQSDFAQHFCEFIALTRNAATELGDIQHCPNFIRGFVQHLTQGCSN